MQMPNRRSNGPKFCARSSAWRLEGATLCTVVPQETVIFRLRLCAWRAAHGLTGRLANER